MAYSTRRTVAVVLGAAVIAMASGCSGNGGQSPSTTTPTTTTSTTTPSPAPPTEKSIDPNGGNLFTPQVIAPPAPTEPPGVHRKH